MENDLPDTEGGAARFRVGDSVTGKVIGRQPYGVWVDIGVGRLALLLVTRFRRADSPIRADGYQGYPAVGERLSARVCVVDDRGCIGLTQLDAEE